MATRKLEIIETGFVTKQYRVENAFGNAEVEVVFYKGRLHSITLHTWTTIKLMIGDLRILQEVLQLHPLPEEVEE